MKESINEKWECHLCGFEKDFEILPSGYLGNYHPLCERCADEIFNDETNTHHLRLTYHECVGDINFV
jgi:ribosomal protein L37E